MDSINYKPNSHKYKEEQNNAPAEKRVEKVVRGTAKVKKKSGVHKLADIFISEDIKNVKSYAVMDVLVPAVKKAISDIVKDGIDMIFYGGKTKRSGGGSVAGRISYADYYNRDSGRPVENATRSGYCPNDVVVETRGEAEEVIDRMNELIGEYGEVSVADLYDLVGVTGNYTDNNYGWTNITNAEPVRVNGGYLISLPKVGPLKKH